MLSCEIRGNTNLISKIDRTNPQRSGQQAMSCRFGGSESNRLEFLERNEL